MTKPGLILFASLALAGCARARHPAQPDAETLLNAGDPFGAEAMLRKAWHDSRSRSAAMQYAALVLERDNWREALSVAKQYGDSRLSGEALERSGDYAAAIKMLKIADDKPWLCRAATEANDAPEANAVCPQVEDPLAKSMWLLAQGNYGSAEECLRAALARLEPNARDVRRVSILHSLLGRVLIASGNARGGETELWRALAKQERVLGGSVYLSDTVLAIGVLLLDEGHAASAQAHLMYALQIRSNALGAEDWRVQQARGALGACLRAQRRFVDAGNMLPAAYEALVKTRGADAPETVQLNRWLNVPALDAPPAEF